MKDSSLKTHELILLLLRELHPTLLSKNSSPSTPHLSGDAPAHTLPQFSPWKHRGNNSPYLTSGRESCKSSLRAVLFEHFWTLHLCRSSEPSPTQQLLPQHLGGYHLFLSFKTKREQSPNWIEVSPAQMQSTPCSS